LTVAVLPEAQTPLEYAITGDPDWVDGMLWGKPRPGHPEGSVGAHTIEVLANVDRYARTEREREELRLVALFHDACKQQAVRGGPNHGQLARWHAERFLDDERILSVIELHDAGFSLYRQLGRGKDVRGRLGQLIERLQDLGVVDLFLRFVCCDTMTGDKRPDAYLWLCAQFGREGDA
jgi:hypothetical protein